MRQVFGGDGIGVIQDLWIKSAWGGGGGGGGGGKGGALVCGPFPSFLEGILRSHWSWLCYEDNALSGEFGAQVIT